MKKFLSSYFFWNLIKYLLCSQKLKQSSFLNYEDKRGEASKRFELFRDFHDTRYFPNCLERFFLLFFFCTKAEIISALKRAATHNGGVSADASLTRFTLHKFPLGKFIVPLPPRNERNPFANNNVFAGAFQ